MDKLQLNIIEHNLQTFQKVNAYQKFVISSDYKADVDERYLQGIRRKADRWVAHLPSSRQSTCDVIRITYDSLKQYPEYCQGNIQLITQSLANLASKFGLTYANYKELSDLISGYITYFNNLMVKSLAVENIDPSQIENKSGEHHHGLDVIAISDDHHDEKNVNNHQPEAQLPRLSTPPASGDENKNDELLANDKKHSDADIVDPPVIKAIEIQPEEPKSQAPSVIIPVNEDVKVHVGDYGHIESNVVPQTQTKCINCSPTVQYFEIAWSRFVSFVVQNCICCK